jgi:RHS repeat-associated protein
LGFRFLYVGAFDVQWDSSYGLDLLYMHARHYSPSIGRFLQPDPSRLDEHLFVYARNQPLVQVDPSGTTPFCLIPPVTLLCARVVVTIGIAVVRAAITALKAHKPTGAIPSVLVRNLAKINRGEAWRTQKLAEAARKYPKDTRTTQCHHIFPKWMGGLSRYWTIRIPTHYHKAITARFAQAPYYQRYRETGWLPPTWQRVVTMLEVYSELPINDPHWRIGWGCP